MQKLLFMACLIKWLQSVAECILYKRAIQTVLGCREPVSTKIGNRKFLYLLVALAGFFNCHAQTNAWIRVNQLGYLPDGSKVAVWAGKINDGQRSFQLVDAGTSKTVYTANAGKAYGSYGPFSRCYRLNFTVFRKPGSYYVKCGETLSPVFRIANNVYAGTAEIFTATKSSVFLSLFLPCPD